ncbi:DUF6172 family protein [Variovorax sp. KK3]|uniref:DUF6172 family protein n=1 Tax=Variovorax sp. KK3 TaxID=1855728 RepID=UPI0015C2C766|nr:DUF6172 family protein [Variovorax sp. KK3]
MNKSFSKHLDGKKPDRMLDAVRCEGRTYVLLERRRDLPEGTDLRHKKLSGTAS